MLSISKNLGDTTFSNHENHQVSLGKKHLSIVINEFETEAEMQFWFDTISSMILDRNKINAEKKRADINKRMAAACEKDVISHTRKLSENKS